MSIKRKNLKKSLKICNYKGNFDFRSNFHLLGAEPIKGAKLLFGVKCPRRGYRRQGWLGHWATTRQVGHGLGQRQGWLEQRQGRLGTGWGNDKAGWNNDEAGWALGLVNAA
jgi:hypothetical protein